MDVGALVPTGTEVRYVSAIREAVLAALTLVDVTDEAGRVVGNEVRFPSGAVLGRTTAAGEFVLEPEYRAPEAAADPGTEAAAPAEPNMTTGELTGGDDCSNDPPGKLGT